MKLTKSNLTPEAVAVSYYETARSVLQSMMDATMKENFPMVFVNQRPFLECCYRGTQVCLVDPDDIDDKQELDEVGKAIDSVIYAKFAAWGVPSATKELGRYATVLNCQILGALAEVVKCSTLIQRLHNDVHQGFAALEFYNTVERIPLLSLHCSVDICATGFTPFLMNFRQAVCGAFPKSSVAQQGLLRDPLEEKVSRLCQKAKAEGAWDIQVLAANAAAVR